MVSPVPELRATRRVAAQQAVLEATDRIVGAIGSRAAGERSERLVEAATAVWDAAWGPNPNRDDVKAALIEYLAEGQAWLEDLTAENKA